MSVQSILNKETNVKQIYFLAQWNVRSLYLSIDIIITLLLRKENNNMVFTNYVSWEPHIRTLRWLTALAVHHSPR